MQFYPALDVVKTSGVVSRESDVVETTPEVVLAELDGHGPTAVEEIPGGIRIFFPNKTSRNEAFRTASAIPHVMVTSVDIAGDDWAARSQSALTPITIDDICVTPPWAIDAARASGVTHTIVIQPSMGFGTGHHASTRLCLKWLQQIPIAGARVLDVGTGSGVLAIAAERLGAGAVVGIDIDEDALENARENLELNGAARVVELRVAGLEDAAASGERFDIVMANLTGALLMRASEALAALAAPDARLVASGFEKHELAAVVADLERAGWQHRESLEEAGWVGVLMTRT